jgi:hypothetical protein
MNKTIKIILILTISIIGIVKIGLMYFVGYLVFSFTNGCGMDDGPFKAVRIDSIQISDSVQTFDLSDNGKLILDNRNDTLSPILTLIEEGNVKWTLDTDVRNTKGYETCRIWEISNLTVRKKTDPIKLSFTGHWTYGAEAGSMEIDRDDGENSYCLSW